MVDSGDVNPKKRGLGRGLDAIFGEDNNNTSHDSSESDSLSELTANEIINDDLKRRTMPVEWLIPCDFQPRKHFDKHALEELSKSIAMHGILQPIVVRPLDDESNKYEIIAGERRWRASQMAQLHEVPVIIQYLDDEAVLEIALIENLQREDLSAIEEANALQQLMDNYGHTQEKLSATIGKSRSHIANILRLLQLPQSVQGMVNEGKISAGHARSLVGRDDAEAMANKIISDQLSVRDVEGMVKSNKKKSKSKSGKQPKEVNTAALEEEMSRLLGMNVTINTKGSNKGQIKIDYKSLDQLDDVLHRLSKN